MNEYLKILGMKVRDRVTSMEGVATSVSFDLFGCIQVIINPGLDKDGKPRDSAWYDFQRLEVISGDPVMTRPLFSTEPAQHATGGNALPLQGKP